MKRIAMLATVCCFAALPGFTQSRFGAFTGYVGGGFSEPVSDVGKRLDNHGWNISAGAGVSGKRVGLMLDFMFNDFGINRTSLDQVQAPDGSVRYWAFTLDPVIHLNRESPVDVYVTGGGGIYHRTIEFTQPGLATVTAFDPWFGFYPATVATNQVIGSYGLYKPGVNAGAGIAFRLGSSHAKVFAEARYHHMFTSGSIDNSFIPVTFGIRW